jgi:hypothetical protein
MKMSPLPETAWCRLRRALAITLLLALAACAPGTGGTGTGPTPSGSYASAVVGGSDVALPGSQCAGSCATFLLQLEPERVAFGNGCLQFAHAGGWEVDANGVATLEGEVTRAGVVTAGTLRLQFEGDALASTLVRATLFDAAGGVLAGPLPLQRRDGPPAPGTGSCL